MLAKELKINNLMQQRAFITEAIKNHFNSRDGSTTVIYVGQLFEENVSYFTHEGFKIISIEPERAVLAKHHPIHVFLIDENKLDFSSSDLDKAQDIEIRKTGEEYDNDFEKIKDALDSMLGY